ncbi:MAG: hypothetical protein JXQ30_08845 [Spirochaetes bacterium]|nr:hypothetical protein [Spirochaetota bacterium]
MKKSGPAVVCAAFEREIERFETLLHGVRRLRLGGVKLIRGSLGGREVEVICAPKERFFVPEAKIEGFEILVSTGICGGLSPSLRCGDLVVASKLVFFSPADIRGQSDDQGPINIPQSGTAYGLLCSALSSKPYRIVRGVAVTAEKPLRSVEEKKNAARRTGGVSVDMEDFYRLTVAKKLGIPFLSIRAVYDVAKEGVPESPGMLDGKGVALCAGSIADALQAVLCGGPNFT